MWQMSRGKVLTTYGYEVSNARGVNQDAWEYALKLGRKYAMTDADG